MEKIPEERLFYINDHPRMKSRKQEENRLKQLSEEICGKYKNTDNFIELLREYDDCCHDNVQDATCNSNDPIAPVCFVRNNR